MKKVLASLISVSSALCLTGVANAQSVPATSVHSGAITASCAVTATDSLAGLGVTSDTGAPFNLPTQLTTTDNTGKFTTACNSIGTISVATTGSFTAAGGSTSAPLAASQVLFRLNQGTGAFDNATGTTVLPTGYNSGTFAPATDISNVANGYAPSTMVVRGRVNKLATDTVLPAGDYEVKVTATVAP